MHVPPALPANPAAPEGPEAAAAEEDHAMAEEGMAVVEDMLLGDVENPAAVDAEVMDVVEVPPIEVLAAAAPPVGTLSGSTAALFDDFHAAPVTCVVSGVQHIARLPLHRRWLRRCLRRYLPIYQRPSAYTIPHPAISPLAKSTLPAPNFM